MIFKDFIDIMINNTEFKIPVKNLLIRKYQTYTVKEEAQILKRTLYFT